MSHCTSTPIPHQRPTPTIDTSSPMTALREDPRPDGTLLLRSAMLASAGFPHAFSTSIGPGGRLFDLSRPGHSPIETRADRLQPDIDLFSAAVVSDATLHSSHQVHGIDLVHARVADDRDADAVCTTDPRMIAAVRTADCVPILLACPARNEAVAVHAGWRGLVNDVPGAAVRWLASRNSVPEEIIGAIGPAIGADAFEIGPEVAKAFEAAGLGAMIRPGSPRPHADLHAAARRRLLAAGVVASRIDGEPTCTASSRRFFSHRRDGGRTGRHLAAIAARGPAGSDPSYLRP